MSTSEYMIVTAHASIQDTVCLEYIWVDGMGELRSKIKVMSREDQFRLLETSPETLFKVGAHEVFAPWWNFDGSSTQQAIGKESDVILKPVRVYKNPFFTNATFASYLVLCECYDKDGETPHKTNTRAYCADVSLKYAAYG